MFIDEAKIYLKAGNGGWGCESFHRDMRQRHKQPDGGDGGKGGDVYFIADRGLQTLMDFRFNQHFKAASGGNASSKNKTGRNGQDLYIRVPVGTLIKDQEKKIVIKDLIEHGQTVMVARGGAGGFGNQNHKETRTPEYGEEVIAQLELKLIADVGLVGFPNAGKSTIVSNISRVKSKIANYPFTTKSPILGFVDVEASDYYDSSFVVADLPGIIEGAHLGKGLGDKFLKHAERTKVIVHVIDMGGTEGRDPLEDYTKICHELDEYSALLNKKVRMVVANKMDVEGAKDNLKRFKEKITDDILEISAINQAGLDEFIKRSGQLVEMTRKAEEDEE